MVVFNVLCDWFSDRLRVCLSQVTTAITPRSARATTDMDVDTPMRRRASCLASNINNRFGRSLPVCDMLVTGFYFFALFVYISKPSAGYC